MGEFDLIERFFKRPAQLAQLAQPYLDVALGIGDDCALLQLGPNEQLAVSTDLLIEGRHFFANVNPRSLGHKSLAVNLSDLAAMGAKPLGFTLALSLPSIEENWLTEFSKGLFDLANLSRCPLVGGDTTAGPLSIGITIMGKVGKGQALKRSGALLGDDIYISGALGWARLGLQFLQNQLKHPLSEADQKQCIKALEWPQARLALGSALCQYASAALDLSDGLSGDLLHILKASQLGAVLFEDQLVASLGTLDYWQHLTVQEKAQWALAGGDDYELCFTAPSKHRHALEQLSQQNPQWGRLHRIGCTTANGLLQMSASETSLSQPTHIDSSGFDHFSHSTN